MSDRLGHLGPVDPGPAYCLGGACPHDHDDPDDVEEYQEPVDG